MAFAAQRGRVHPSSSSSSASAYTFDFAFDVPPSTISAAEVDAWFAAPHPLLSAATSTAAQPSRGSRDRTQTCDARVGARRRGVKRNSKMALQPARRGRGRVVMGEENATVPSYARRRKKRAAMTSEAIDEIADLIAVDGAPAAPTIAAPPSTVGGVTAAAAAAAAAAAPCRAERRRSRRLSGGAVFDDAASARRVSRGASLAGDGAVASVDSVDVDAAALAAPAAPALNGAPKESAKRPRRRSNLGSARRRVSAAGSRLGGARRISRERGLR